MPAATHHMCTTRSPAVILSFLVAGISALLSALCYSEFAAEVSTRHRRLAEVHADQITLPDSSLQQVNPHELRLGWG
jgi:hypothetical protein